MWKRKDTLTKWGQKMIDTNKHEINELIATMVDEQIVDECQKETHK